MVDLERHQHLEIGLIISTLSPYQHMFSLSAKSAKNFLSSFSRRKTLAKTGTSSAEKVSKSHWSHAPAYLSVTPRRFRVLQWLLFFL